MSASSIQNKKTCIKSIRPVASSESELAGANLLERLQIACEIMGAFDPSPMNPQSIQIEDLQCIGP
jgi:hypothetical protein